MSEAFAFLPDAATLAAFLAASLALNFTPGADLMFSIASGASGGPRGAVVNSDGGGWKRRPASRRALGLSRPNPTRRWQSAQKDCSWWHEVHDELACWASIACIEM